MLRKTSRVLGVALVAVSLAVALTVYGRANAEKDEKKGQPTAEPLKQLMDRIEKLEARVAELEKRQKVIVVPQPPSLPKGEGWIVVPQPRSLPKGQLPKGWVEKEFNGIPYYIVPCRPMSPPMGNP